MATSAVLKIYGICVLVFLVLDFVWLTVVAQSFYEAHLGSFIRQEPVIGAAVVLYLLLVAGIVVFAVLPGVEAESLGRTLALAVLLGLVTYGTFDLTCYALFEGFPLRVVIVDLIWGAFLTSLVATAGYYGAGWVAT